MGIEEIQEMADRAMFFGITNDYLDAQKIYYLENGNIIFDLTHYVAETRELEIEIPNGVYGVLMDIYDYAFVENGEYRFIFPESLHYFGYTTGLDSGKVYLSNMQNWLTNMGLFDFYQNTVFDFSRCKYLTHIHDKCFKHFCCKELLFNESLISIKPNAFENSKIEYLSLPGLKSAGVSGFCGAEISNLYAPNIEDVELEGLVFGTVKDEIKLNKLQKLNRQCFGNISNIYLGYDLKAYKQEGIDFVTNFLRTMKSEDSSSLFNAYSELHNFSKERDVKFTSNMLVKLYESIQVYSVRNVTQMLLDTISRMIVRDKGNKEFPVNFYLYRKDNICDVHTRGYKNLGILNYVTVYLEQ